LKRSGLITLERRRYNSRVQNYQWERNTTAGKVLCISTKEGNSGTQLYIGLIVLFQKPKGTLGQKFFSARCVDFWNVLDNSTVSVEIIALFSGC